MSNCILIVEDEIEIGELVRDYLVAEGYEVIMAINGLDGLKLFQRHQPILAVLDVMLPKMDGIELCRRIRNESTIPIVMMSAKKSEADKIIGLGIGADDYITKPFSPRELVARIKAHLRRFQYFSAPKEKVENILNYQGLQIDLKGFAVRSNDKQIDLSAKEFQLLTYLASHKDQVFSKEQLLQNVWGYDYFGEVNTITVYIRKLREKIEPDPSNPIYIKTVWGIGYKFEGKRQS